ncbi:MAG: hypothetical protein OCC49_02800 [Fibrobacterales bacterium]
MKRVIAVIIGLCLGSLMAQNNQMKMGMNIGSLNYWSSGAPFTDVMTSASELITFTVNVSGWNTQVLDQIPRDSAGYPTELPVSVNGASTGVRFLINNSYSGEYHVTFEGEGDINWSVDHEERGGNHYITLTGEGGHKWLNITRSTAGNHLRGFKIIPVAYENNPENEIPLFREEFLSGLRPFKTLRFMNWTATNNSLSEDWDKRTQVYHYSQGRGYDNNNQAAGIAIEHAIALANELQVDAWFCIPHKANREYITKFAELVKEQLDPNLKVYIEYSNELWNWIFQQSHYATGNAAEGESDVTVGLEAVSMKYCNTLDGCHPEKDAYLMARTFTIWEEVWASERSRLITVAAVQGGWPGNTGRVLEYLFNDDGVGADAVSPTAYFGFGEEQHNYWNSLEPSSVTAEMIIDAVDSLYESHTGRFVDAHKKYADDFGMEYIIYEGGQHMQPWRQGEWDYNQAVWDAQVHPKMYDLYIKNLQRHIDAGVSLFTAFSYVGGRESQYGSWGHLESLGQLNAGDLKGEAPKYQALLDSPMLIPESGAVMSSSSEIIVESSGAIEVSSVEQSSNEEILPINKKIFYIGHSLMNTTIPVFVNYIAEDAGDENSYGYQIIPGSPLKWNWNNDGSNSYNDEGYGAAFASGTFTDVVMTEALELQSHITYSQTYEYAYKFDSLAKEGNPEVQAYMFESWHCIFSGVEGSECYENNQTVPWRDRLQSDLPVWELIADSVAGLSSGKPMLMIPGGQTMAALYDSLALGVVPGRSSHDEFFSDDIHPNNDGWYMIAMLYYSVLYKKSPLELTDTIYNVYGGIAHTVEPALGRKLREIAWHTACNYEPLGIACEESTERPSSNEAESSETAVSSEDQISSVVELSSNDCSQQSELSNSSEVQNEESVSSYDVSSSGGVPGAISSSSDCEKSSDATARLYVQKKTPVQSLTREGFHNLMQSGRPFLIIRPDGQAEYLFAVDAEYLSDGIYFISTSSGLYRYHK